MTRLPVKIIVSDDQDVAIFCHFHTTDISLETSILVPRKSSTYLGDSTQFPTCRLSMLISASVFANMVKKLLRQQSPLYNSWFSSSRNLPSYTSILSYLRTITRTRDLSVLLTQRATISKVLVSIWSLVLLPYICKYLYLWNLDFFILESTICFLRKDIRWRLLLVIDSFYRLE